MPESNRLLLDAPVKEDFTRFYEIHSDPQNNLFNPLGPMDMEKATAAFERSCTHWADHHFGSWVIRDKTTGNIIGFGGLSYRMYGDELKLNLGYRFAKDSWGQGFATELSQYAIGYGFNILQVEKIFAIVRPLHIVSIKVLEKCAMRHSGTLNDVPGEAESLVFVITREEYTH